MLIILALMWGCGGGGGATTTEVVKGASLSVVHSSNNEYVIQGSNLEGVAAMKIIVSYDGSTLSLPTVIKGGLVSDSLMVNNTGIPGSIIIAFINTKDLSGTGQIASVSFATVTGQGTIAIVSAETYNSNGSQLTVTF